MKFFDTERLLPSPTDSYVAGLYGNKFKQDYDATHNDPNMELGFAYNSVAPLYAAAAFYSTDRMTGGSVPTRIQPQICPVLNGGLTPSSYKYTIDGINSDEFYGTYYYGWRYGQSMGYVVPNPVGGYTFTWLKDERSRAKIQVLWKTYVRAAFFNGGYATVQGSSVVKLRNTVCGYYQGVVRDKSTYDWKIKQVSDNGLAYSRCSGFRSKWINGITAPYDISKFIWQRAMRMLRAYTGYVAQTAGSSGLFSQVYLLANGCWEQVYASNFYVKHMEFEEIMTDQLELAGRGAALFHMVDLMDLFANQSRLTTEVESWNGNHPKFYENVYDIVNLEVSNFAGTSEEGTLKQTIPYVNLVDEEVIGLLAKCKGLVGGYNQVKVEVVDPFGWNGEKSVVVQTEENASFNGSILVAQRPNTTCVVFENLFCVKTFSNKPTTEEILTLGVEAAPIPRDTFEKRISSRVIPSIELFPTSRQKDDGLLPPISKVVAVNTVDAMEITISVEGYADMTIPFMPVATTLIEDRNACLRIHDFVACGHNYGYGYIDRDPFSGLEGVKIFNTAPAASAYNGQERWHVPYKELIGIAWERGVEPIDNSTFSQNAASDVSPYIYKAISSVDLNNRYLKYDMAVRPPTYLPLFMCAEVCHEDGAAGFAIALADALISLLQITFEGDTIKFGVAPPAWVTDDSAFYESIVTLLLMGTRRGDKYETAAGAEVEVAIDEAVVLKGTTSSEFWVMIAEAAGLESVSDLITHYGMTEGVVNVPPGVLVAASLKPIEFGAAMGVTVIKKESGYAIGSRTYDSLAEVSAALVEIAGGVVATDTSNPENIAASLGIPDTTELEAQPKRYATPFNWLLLLPHALTAIGYVAAKATNER